MVRLSWLLDSSVRWDFCDSTVALCICVLLLGT